MIKHVVMWKMRGPSAAEKQEQAARVSSALKALHGKIPGMQSLEVGIPITADSEQPDVLLITTHDDVAALELYQHHPEHQAVAELIGQLRVERRVLDFEY